MRLLPYNRVTVTIEHLNFPLVLWISMLALLTLGLTLSFLVRPLIAVGCYRPDGALVPDPDYIPCKPENAAKGSSCCALKRISYPDRCLPNGLCGNGDDVFRDSCTDETWDSPLCPQLCTFGFGASGADVGENDTKGYRAFPFRYSLRNMLDMSRTAHWRRSLTSTVDKQRT